MQTAFCYHCISTQRWIAKWSGKLVSGLINGSEIIKTSELWYQMSIVCTYNPKITISLRPVYLESILTWIQTVFFLVRPVNMTLLSWWKAYSLRMQYGCLVKLLYNGPPVSQSPTTHDRTNAVNYVDFQCEDSTTLVEPASSCGNQCGCTNIYGNIIYWRKVLKVVVRFLEFLQFKFA